MTFSWEWKIISTDELIPFRGVGIPPTRIYKLDYPLVNVNKKLWKITMLLMGKSTISMAMFNSYVSLPEGKLGILSGDHFKKL